MKKVRSSGVTPGLADLAPNITGSVLALAVIAVIRWLMDSRAVRSSQIADDVLRT